jgi:hypothetical protein
MSNNEVEDLLEEIENDDPVDQDPELELEGRIEDLEADIEDENVEIEPTNTSRVTSGDSNPNKKTKKSAKPDSYIKKPLTKWIIFTGHSFSSINSIVVE